MTRGATNGVLPDDHQQKHPQPVIAPLLPSGVQEGTYSPESPSSSRRPHTAQQDFGDGHDGSDTEEDEPGLMMGNGSRPPNRLPLPRSQSDMLAHDRRRKPPRSDTTSGEKDGGDEKRIRMRHGWEAQLQDQEQATLLSQTFFMYYEDKRHETAGNPPPEYDPKTIVSEWRMKDRLKTVSAILAVCLNVGVDPPDVIKTNPCARLECWIDPIPPDSSAAAANGAGGQSSSSNTANNTNSLIAKTLQSQYENLSLRTRYKVILDPTIEELKRYTTSLRRTAHAERILFHYNGHGVPRPTQSGEVWCFNRSYTQYIPVGLQDLGEWVGGPGVWVWDCSNAGGIINNFLEGVRKHKVAETEAAKRAGQQHGQQAGQGAGGVAAQGRWEDCIHLAACRENETLPTNPDLPADIFTSCLTTPIAMAVRFFILTNPLPFPFPVSTTNATTTSTSSNPNPNTTPPLNPLDLARLIPGRVSERRTPLGELNWIFTAITDTIAWNCLPPQLFKKLFRQDLMVAALFRNFLLALRVLRRFGCHPQSYPRLDGLDGGMGLGGQTGHGANGGSGVAAIVGHHLWGAWDQAVEGVLGQVGGMLERERVAREAAGLPAEGVPSVAPAIGGAPEVQANGQPGQQQVNGNQPGGGQQPPPAVGAGAAPGLGGVGAGIAGELEYQHSDFFADQLSAFEVYLSAAPSHSTSSRGNTLPPKPPEQLPIVLQVLLSQVHRLRALILLSKFLDLGPWAVNLALSIGIFPYVLKLLQSQALELKPPMVFIWARILAVDQSCQGDLLKDSGFGYFTGILCGSGGGGGMPLGNVSEHRAMCAFVLAQFCGAIPGPGGSLSVTEAFRPAQQAVLEACPEIVEGCLQHLLDMENPLLRQWSLLCLGNVWRGFESAKKVGLACQAHARICDRSHDPVPEVRAAALDALTSFVGTGQGEGGGTLDAGVVLEEETLASVVISMGMDGSIMVRKELTHFYAAFIRKYEGRFVVAAWEQLLEERDKRSGRGEEVERDWDGAVVGGAEGDGASGLNGLGVRSGGGGHQGGVSFTTQGSDLTNLSSSEVGSKPSRKLSKKTIYRAMWRQILSMSADPHPEVARNASIVVDYVLNALLDSPLGDHANRVIDELAIQGLKRDHATLSNGLEGGSSSGGGLTTRQRSQRGGGGGAGGDTMRPQTPPSPTASTMSKHGDGYFGLSRTASVANAMKNFFGVKTPTEAPPSPTRSHRGSIGGGGSSVLPYRSRPLTPGDAAMLPPDALDQINGPPHQPRAKVPKSPYFVERDLTQPPEIPLRSNFYTWSAGYFREPQMRASEADEPGSLDYNERLWRRNRNDKIIASTQPLKEAAGSQRWDVPCGYFGIGAAPVKMVFHQFENHLVTSDDRDSVAVWDWEQATQLARFSNGNPSGSRVTEVRFINEDDRAMLMTGSSDGVIKIFRGYEDGKRVELASSFRALSDLVVSDQRNAGLVFDWQQGQGRILVAGDDRVIRVWQAGHELCIADIPARSGSCITSLTSDQVEGNVFVAGFGNGSVRAYDQRLSSRDSMIMDWVDRKTDHRSWIVGVHLQRGGMRELVSAESNGGVRLWDIRMRKAVHGLPGKKDHPRSLRTLAVHEHAPVFATGSADHTIRVFNTGEGELRQLSSFEPYMSYLRVATAPRHAPITATAFHPHRMMMACGAVNDGHVNLFKCEAVKGEEKREGVGVGVVEEWRGLEWKG